MIGSTIFLPQLSQSVYMSGGQQAFVDAQALSSVVGQLVAQVNTLTMELSALKEQQTPFVSWVAETHPELVQQFITTQFVAGKLEASRKPK
jgi:hypothetical protein